jgi:hypothetical protein
VSERVDKKEIERKAPIKRAANHTGLITGLFKAMHEIGGMEKDEKVRIKGEREIENEKVDRTYQNLRDVSSLRLYSCLFLASVLI